MSADLAPGYYWVVFDGERVPVEWTGKTWWGIAMQRPYEPAEIVDPIPAVPPALPITSQGA